MIQNSSIKRSKVKLRRIINKISSPILSSYYFGQIRGPKQWGGINYDAENSNVLFQMLVKNGIETKSIKIDIDDYLQYFEIADYANRYPNYYKNSINEKSIEHYIAQKILHLSSEDTYIDIASETSPVPEIYQRLYGCETYAQDLAFDPGLNGNLIGSDAASMPVPDGFATKMALHCSFEHFEQDSDIGFIQECFRVLAPKGMVVIVPLYLNKFYAIQTDPMVSVPSKVDFETNVPICCVNGWGNRHGRFYDPKQLKTRIIDQFPELKFEVICVTNIKEVHSSCYAHFVLTVEKP